MSLYSKFSNIKHSMKYKTLQQFKFFTLKKSYAKNRKIAISLLSNDSSVVEIEKSILKNKFVKEYDELKHLNKIAFKYVNKFIALIYSNEYQLNIREIYE